MYRYAINHNYHELAAKGDKLLKSAKENARTVLEGIQDLVDLVFEDCDTLDDLRYLGPDEDISINLAMSTDHLDDIIQLVNRIQTAALKAKADGLKSNQYYDRAKRSRST